MTVLPATAGGCWQRREVGLALPAYRLLLLQFAERLAHRGHLVLVRIVRLAGYGYRFVDEPYGVVDAVPVAMLVVRVVKWQQAQFAGCSSDTG